MRSFGKQSFASATEASPVALAALMSPQMPKICGVCDADQSPNEDKTGSWGVIAAADSNARRTATDTRSVETLPGDLRAGRHTRPPSR